MAFAVLIGVALFHRAEKCVAGAEADGGLTGLDEAEADDARRIIAGPHSGERFGIEAVFGDEVGTNRADDAAGVSQRRQFFHKAGRGGLERVVVPIFPADVHEVHPRAVTEINRRYLASEQRRHERADERNAGGFVVGLRFGFVELADLRAGEAFEGVRAGARGGKFNAAKFFADLGAFLRGRRIHPDG